MPYCTITEEKISTIPELSREKNKLFSQSSNSVGIGKYNELYPKFERVINEIKKYSNLQFNVRFENCEMLGRASIHGLTCSYGLLTLTEMQIRGIIAHEVGHLVNRHFAPPRSLYENRQREIDADYFAVKFLADMDYPIDELILGFASAPIDPNPLAPHLRNKQRAIKCLRDYNNLILRKDSKLMSESTSSISEVTELKPTTYYTGSSMTESTNTILYSYPTRVSSVPVRSLSESVPVISSFYPTTDASASVSSISYFVRSML